MTCIAVPFDPQPPAKLAKIVSDCMMFRPWFSDQDWEAGEHSRRTQVIARLANLDSKSWEVYRGAELVGLLHADRITPHVDAYCHFIFFDRDLASKRDLCRATMRWLYGTYDLHVLRLEIPTYAAKLAGFVRKALHFRWEAEGRSFSWPASAPPLDANAAKLGSRKHHAILHQGEWHDILLLSLTRDEFEAGDMGHPHRPDSKPAQTDRIVVTPRRT